jgi:hypothetical protein
MQMNDTGNDNVCLECNQGTQSPGVDQTNVYNQLLMYNVKTNHAEHGNAKNMTQQEGGNEQEPRIAGGSVDDTTITTTINLVSATRTRLVNDVHESMTPATCRKNNRSLATRKKNLYEGCRLIMWLYGICNTENGETRRRLKQLLDDRLLDKIDEEVHTIAGARTERKTVSAVRNAIKSWLQIEDGPAPFAFAGFSYDDYSNYLRVQLRHDGLPLRGKCYKNKRSNLNNLFKRYKYQPTTDFQEKVGEYLDGVVRVVAAAAQSGVGSIVSGKREMSFELYEKVMIWFLQERSHEGIFARAFLALTWNLMCRGVNSCVCLKHLLWKNDSFGLSFSHVKNDQDGSRNFHPRHIYANPDNYLVCCVTAIFEYLLCYPGLFQDEHAMLFPGPRQEERFSLNLTNILVKHEEELRNLGYVPSDIGVHSIRKGAGTYASSGTTAAPSSVAVNNRGGWTLGGARDVYMLYERAGDQYVGRILSGMNVLSPKFGASCPDFFHHGAGELFDGPEQVVDANQLQAQITSKVSLALASCFGDLELFVAIRKTLQFGLASLLHHVDSAMHHHGASRHIDASSPADIRQSPLSLSPVFRNKDILGLKDHVRVIYPWDSDKSSESCIMRLTGIPPHVVQLAQIKQLQESVASISPLILESVGRMLDDRTVNGVLSEARMRSLMQSVLMEEGLSRVPAPAQEHTNQLQVDTVVYNGMVDGESLRHSLWMHRGKFRRVPPGWTFPKCNVHSAHKLWHIQNTVNGQCAMRFLRPADIDHYKDGHRRLEEFRFLMWRFDECARQLGLLRHTMTELDCSIAINATIEMLGVPLETPTGRRRHLERLKWPMYLSLMPAKQRPSIEDLAVTYQGKRRL